MLTRNQWHCGGNREDAREEVKMATADGRGGRVEGSDDREGTREGKVMTGNSGHRADGDRAMLTWQAHVAEASYGLRKAWENNDIGLNGLVVNLTESVFLVCTGREFESRRVKLPKLAELIMEANMRNFY
jgi:hypothetical protein